MVFLYPMAVMRYYPDLYRCIAPGRIIIWMEGGRLHLSPYATARVRVFIGLLIAAGTLQAGSSCSIDYLAGNRGNNTQGSDN